MNAADPVAILRRLELDRGARQPFEQGWRECADYTYPERGNGLAGGIVTAEDAQRRKIRILDDTAAEASRTLAAGMVSGTTPANSRWFGMDAGQDTEDEKRWLDDSSQIIFENIHAANFDAASFECMIDLCIAGWFVLYIDEAEDGGYQFEQWPIAQCFVSASKPGGLIDSIRREVEFTVEQVVSKYGLDNVSAKTRQAYAAERFTDKVCIVHAIYPRKLSVVGGQRSKNLPFASCHIEKNGKHLLRESGYHEFPCVVPRWMVAPGSVYATGPLSQCLGSIRTLHDIKTLELSNLDMSVCGMFIAEDDGVLNPRSVKVGPRKVIVANSVDSMKPLQTGADFNVAFTAEERLQAAIRKAMLADQLQPQDGPAMTATEVHVRVQLIRQLLGPIYGRLQAEYLKPMIDRCFGLAYRAGVLGQPPESLAGRVFNVTYISPLARAQKLEEATAIEQYVAGSLQLAEAFPEVMDGIDMDEAQKVRGEAYGVPSRVLRTTKQIAAIRDARQKAQQQSQQQAMQQEVMAKAAPAMLEKAVA